jgi:hypothetical protein
MVLNQRTVSPYWFIFPLSLIYLTAALLVYKLPLLTAPEAVTVGISLDLVLLAPLIYYLVMVRGRNWPAITVIPVFLLNYVVAYTLLPMQFHGTLTVIGYLLPVVEVGVISYAGYQITRLIRSGRASDITEGDFYHNLYRLLRDKLAFPAAIKAVSYEISVFYYAFQWQKSELPDHAIPYRGMSGYAPVFGALLFVAMIELVAVHFLLSLWSPIAVFIHAILSVYAIIWLIGDFRAMHARPHIITTDSLSLRLGLRWEVTITPDQIAEIRSTKRSLSDDEQFLNLTPVGNFNTILFLKEPVIAQGPYGLSKSVSSLGLILDDVSVLQYSS